MTASSDMFENTVTNVLTSGGTVNLFTITKTLYRGLVTQKEIKSVASLQERLINRLYNPKKQKTSWKTHSPSAGQEINIFV